jgi:hypothetical protein
MRYGWAVLALATVAFGCGGTTVDQMTGPGAVKCAIALSAATQDVSAAASQFAVDIDASRECAWDSRSDASWVQTSPASGQGQASLTVTVGTNTQQTGRTATVFVNDASMKVTQAAAPAPCSYALSPPTRSFSENGGTGTVAVQTGSSCTWNASTGASWITISNTSGTGPGTVIYVVERNQSHNSRTGTISVAGRTHTVTEAGR